jgi:hypothetical protein
MTMQMQNHHVRESNELSDLGLFSFSRLHVQGPFGSRTESEGFPAEADPRMQIRAMTNFMVGRLRSSSLKMTSSTRIDKLAVTYLKILHCSLH